MIPSLLDSLSNIKTNYNATTAPTVNDDLLSGYSIGSQWINTSTDEYYICLDNSQSAAVWRNMAVTGESFKGAWNASTNTPTLIDGTGTNGDFYIVSVAGTQNLGSGSIDFTVGDQVIYNGVIWQKIESGVSYVPENVANKATDFTTINDTLYPSVEAVKEQLDLKESAITPGSSNQFWDGTKTFRQVLDSDLSLSDITTNNASTTKHGFLPKLSGNSSNYFNGQGNWSIPSGIISAYTSVSFTAQTSIIVNHGFGAYPVVQIILSDNKIALAPVEHTSINSFAVTFPTPQTGTIIASVGSDQVPAYIGINSNYTTTANDYIIEALSAGIVITLETAIGKNGLSKIIKNGVAIGPSSAITINAIGGQFIDDLTSITLNNDIFMESVTLYSNGANWRVS